MSYRTFVKLTAKAFRFAFNRPIQRFNIYNRMKKYLGPEAKYFAPAPRAIGAMSQRGSKPLQYPHLESGYKSINQRRMEVLAKGDKDPAKLAEPESGYSRPQKAFSESESDDKFVIGVSKQLEVSKTIMKIEPQISLEANQFEQLDDGLKEKKHRPLPKCTNLPLQNPASIWAVEKVPPGRLNVSQLQEIMLNKLGDDKYWTPKAVAERYNIKEEYADSLLKSMKQIRIIVTPRMAKALDYVGMNDENYQAAKHLVYHVDYSLRSDIDKKYDDMFLPGEDLDDEVKKLLNSSKTSLEPTEPARKFVIRPEPLRISPLNRPQERTEPTRYIGGEASSNTKPPPNSTDPPDHKS